MKILVVDDDLVSREMLREMLDAQGEVAVAENGFEGFTQFVDAHTNDHPFDLLFLDIMMPDMSGQDLLVKIRSWERNHELRGRDGARIIMATALDDKGNIMKAFNEQCEGYLIKPITKKKIADILADQLIFSKH